VDKYRGIAEIFDKNVERYESWYIKNLDKAKCEEFLIKSFNLKGIGIEIGSGTCYFTRLFKDCIGIDISFEMCKFCKKYRNIEVIHCIGEKLPIKDKSLNYILIIVTICFIDNPKIVLEECYRCLKERGKILICIIPKDSYLGKMYEEKKVRGESIFYKYAKFYTEKDIVDIAEKINLKHIHTGKTLCINPKDCGFICILLEK